MKLKKNIFTISILLVLIFGVNACYGQNNLNGIYRLKHENGSIYFESPEYFFHNDGTFEMKNETDTGPEVGKGKYYFTDSKLVLMFEYYEQEPDTNRSYFTLDNVSYTIGDSINYNVIISNLDRSFYGGDCILADTNGKDMINKETGFPIGWYADKVDGKVQFKVSKNLLPFYLKVLLMGYYPISILIYEAIDVNITARMRFSLWTIPRVVKPATIQKYWMKDFSEDGFSIKRYDESYWNYYVKKTK